MATLTGLLGPAKSIVAMTTIVNPERTVDNKGKIKVEAEDNAMLIMEHANGVLSDVQRIQLFCPRTQAGPEPSTIRIWGDKGNMGMIGYDWEPLGVELAISPTDPPEILEKESQGYMWQEGASVISESMVKGIEPRISAEHALHVLEIIEAARKSSDTGKKIQLQSTFKWPMF
jgi:predicted dehydrogenase